LSWSFISRVAIVLALAWMMTAPAHGQANPQHDEFGRVQEFAPLVWLARDERLYPVLPHGFAFDGKDNDGDGLRDLEDPKEVLMGEGDLETSNRLVETLRGLDFFEELSALPEPEPESPERRGSAEKKELRTLLSSRAATTNRERLNQATLPSLIRALFKRRGIDLSPWCDWDREGASRYSLNEHLRLGSFETKHWPASPADEKEIEGLVNDLRKRGFGDETYRLRAEANGYTLESRSEPALSVRYRILARGDSVDVYSGVRRYQLSVEQGDKCVHVSRADKLPPSRVSYAQRDARNLPGAAYLKVYEFWFYYLLDIGEGPHLHDGEQAFVFVKSPREVVSVAAGGHTDATANNILVRGSALRTDVQLPRSLPSHMPILVELGKHASAPDRDFNGRFDVGSDANAFYQSVWGSRDLAAAFGINVLRHVQSEFSFPRGRETLVLEEKWKETARKLATGNTDPSYTISLSPTDSAYMLQMSGAVLDLTREYRLFPVEDMMTLVRLVDQGDSDSTVMFLQEHRACFWNDPPPVVKISPAAFQAMRSWPRKKDEKRDAWRHHLYQRPADIFKMWLFPRAAINTTMMYASTGAVARAGVQLADILGGFKTNTVEGYVDFDLKRGKLRDIGYTYSLFRGNHHGWFYSFAWNAGAADKKNLVAGIGLMPISWDIRSIPKIGSHLWHGQVAVRVSLRGEIHWRQVPSNIDPLQFQVGLQLGIPLLQSRHPLEY